MSYKMSPQDWMMFVRMGLGTPRYLHHFLAFLRHLVFCRFLIVLFYDVNVRTRTTIAFARLQWLVATCGNGKHLSMWALQRMQP